MIRMSNAVAEPEEVMQAGLVEPEFAAQARLLHEFYEAVIQGKPVATTCQDNIKSLDIVFDVIKSCETGLPVHSGKTPQEI